VLAIDASTGAVSFLGNLPPQAKKFQGAATARDGTIWSLPESCQHVLRIRPPADSEEQPQVNVCHGQADTMPRAHDEHVAFETVAAAAKA
jgi:hypothetical protein